MLSAIPIFTLIRKKLNLDMELKNKLRINHGFHSLKSKMIIKPKMTLLRLCLISPSSVKNN